jgi:hypothetical protein
MSTNVPAIRWREPTCKVPWPCILLEGEEKSGKTWAALALGASGRVGMTYLLDLTEGTGDEYGLIPGAKFRILQPVEAAWTHPDILGQVRAVKAEAAAERAAGRPPVVFVLDSMTILWDSLKNWTNERAKRSKANRELLQRDPEADVRVPRHLWNATDARYYAIMRELFTFPGIVILTARGREVSATGPDGQPIEGKKTHSVSAQRELAFEVSAWVRLFREEPPQVIGGRSVFLDLRPGKTNPKDVPEAAQDTGRLVDWLVFEALRCDPANAQVRDLREVMGGKLTPEEGGEPPEVTERRKIAALCAEQGWDLKAKAEQFRQTYGVPTSEGTLDQLQAFLAELQQDAALARELAETGRAALKALEDADEQALRVAEAERMAS